ncbi:PREDICTED: subtilisin-like protease SBT1.4 [Ipomoea nil]|uniref:subtilisin-like protease SBT1.4 n=1 Tax=Ipomoea nil TaxID=35883 RepID=UPI000901DE00|nr:PREDICTED: subtilisin-like protease SBT1.4 [Ipomoea nil]
MGVLAPSSFLFIFILCLLSVCRVSVSSLEEPKSFIVFMMKSEKPQLFSTHHDWYSSIIHTLSPLSNHSRSSELLYTYEHVAHGFSARLTPSQASELANVPGVISVLPDRLVELQTTRSPQFLGLISGSSNLGPSSDYGADIIIGVLDSGIWPERSSFSDRGLNPIPNSWRNKCEVGPNFPATSCNRKIIGARAYYRGYEAEIGKPIVGEPKSARDVNGHGTHVASIAAGSAVANANVNGHARGEARGIATNARIAVYKVCWLGTCSNADILSGMDQAVADGVHVLSLSLTSKSKTGFALPYDEDLIAIGAFGAVQKGVIVSCAAGNYGPDPYTAVNLAPWILTVGASTIDREFPAVVTLGNSRSFTGTSLYSGVQPSRIQVPVVYGGSANSFYCFPGQLDASKVRGRIVFCEQGDDTSIVDKGVAVSQAGGVGMIVPNLPNEGYQLEPNADRIPTAVVTVADGEIIRQYVRTASFPTARIEFKGTVIGNSPSAPRVAAFSCRGPNFLTPEILKPDVIAPGVNILAAWTGSLTEFNMISGTSMACPHVSGLAAMLKKIYPSWSPAAIKSALMTTAYTVDNSGRGTLIDLYTRQPTTPHAYGSGHVDPTHAVDPGLVYDAGVNDYVDFLCTIGYDSRKIALFLRNSPLVDCRNRNLGNPGSLNYPSFSVLFKNNLQTVIYKRTVKNVAKVRNVAYQVTVQTPSNVRVTVSPNRLVFTDRIDTLSYEVTFQSLRQSADSFGSLRWSDGTHLVTSPIAVSWEGRSVSEL